MTPCTALPQRVVTAWNPPLLPLNFYAVLTGVLQTRVRRSEGRAASRHKALTVVHRSGLLERTYT